MVRIAARLVARLLPFSPALLILPFPGLFRFTCYYYRGAYYKSFWADPPSCAVGEPRTRYRGEHSFPLILQNAHRFFMWVALVFIVLLAYDVWLALWFTDPATGPREFGIGVGTIILAVNVVAARLLHVGLPRRSATSSAAGSTRCRSRRPATWRTRACRASTAVISCSPGAACSRVMSSDLYVRLCSMGVLTDLRLL